MITPSGALCDVCGHYILPVNSDERVNFFRVAQLEGSDLCCHNKCKEDVLAAGKVWENLPSGPLRKVYEEATKVTKCSVCGIFVPASELDYSMMHYAYRATSREGLCRSVKCGPCVPVTPNAVP